MMLTLTVSNILGSFVNLCCAETELAQQENIKHDFSPSALRANTLRNAAVMQHGWSVLKAQLELFDKMGDILKNVLPASHFLTLHTCPPIRRWYFLSLRVCWGKETAGWSSGLMLGPCYSKSHFYCCLDDEKCKKEFITGSLRVTHHRFHDSVYWITFMPAQWALQMTWTRGIHIAQSQGRTEWTWLQRKEWIILSYCFSVSHSHAR